jgi:hypothetical protein
MGRDQGRRALAGAIVLLAVRFAGAAGPSAILNTYALFARDDMHVRTLTLSDGDVGVSNGLLYMRGAVLGPKSDFAGDIVHTDSTTACEDLFANAVVGGATSCKRAGSVPHPIIADIVTACGFPPVSDLECSTNPADDVVVGHNQIKTDLVPGKKYRDLVVEGGGEGPAVLKLNGTYHFCNVRVSRNGSILFQGPSTITVAGSSRISNSTTVGPDPALGAGAPPPGAIKWFVQGTQARFSRKGSISLYACAPMAKMIIGSGSSLTGRFVARSIRVKKSLVTFAPPVPGVCGDTVISPGEQCEANTDCSGGQTCVACACTTPCTTDEDCNQGSPGGTFVCEDGHCVPGCKTDEDCNQGSPGGTFVCEDGHCVPGCHDDMDCEGSAGGAFMCENGHCVPATTTTTTTTSSTTGHSTTSTSTTLHPCTTTGDCPVGVCRDGVCVPECTSDADCNVGSPGGSFVCIDGRCVPSGEICGDCIDNDEDGLIDFEDPDCCDPQAGQLFSMDLRKGRVRPRSAVQSLLRLKGGLARSGLNALIDPLTQQVVVQIHGDAGEVLCATIPAGKFVKKKKAFRFSQKRTPLPVELGRNLDRVVIKILKRGDVRYRVKGKHTVLTTPAEGTLKITLGFASPGTSASQNACSQAVRLFRGGKKGQLSFP